MVPWSMLRFVAFRAPGQPCYACIAACYCSIGLQHLLMADGLIDKFVPKHVRRPAWWINTEKNVHASHEWDLALPVLDWVVLEGISVSSHEGPDSILRDHALDNSNWIRHAAP